MNLNEFIKKNCDVSKSLPNEELIEQMELFLNVSVGSQLKEYLLNYGYIGHDSVELNGLNMDQGMDSDIVTNSKRLHELFKETSGKILIENQGDGDYYLVDEFDSIYRFCPTAKIFEKTDLKLFDYILKRIK